MVFSDFGLTPPLPREKGAFAGADKIDFFGLMNYACTQELCLYNLVGSAAPSFCYFLLLLVRASTSSIYEVVYFTWQSLVFFNLVSRIFLGSFSFRDR